MFLVTTEDSKIKNKELQYNFSPPETGQHGEPILVPILIKYPRESFA
jgi:hypothetical protein